MSAAKFLELHKTTNPATADAGGRVAGMYEQQKIVGITSNSLQQTPSTRSITGDFYSCPLFLLFVNRDSDKMGLRKALINTFN